MKKIRLTKKRLKALEMEITFNDILYEKFRRLHENFAEECKQWNKRKQVLRVVQKNKNGGNYILQIVNEFKTSDGIILEVI